VCFEVNLMLVTIANPTPVSQSPPVNPVLLLRPRLVAGWLGVTTRTLANWAAAGKVPFHRTQHGHLRFVVAELAPAVAAMGRVVPPPPASITQRYPQAVLAVVDPPDNDSSAVEPDQAGEDGQAGGQERTGHTPTASVQLGQFLVRQRFYGACDQTTAELFFDHGREPGHLVRQRHQAAKAICALCPILRDCRLVGRADPSLEGIWGGETRLERRQACHRGAHTGLPAEAGQKGRRLASVAAELARRDGLQAAARALGVPPATLRRVLALYSLGQLPGPASPSATPKGGEPAWPSAGRPPAATTTSRGRGSRSRSSSPSRAGPSPGPAVPAVQTTPATRPPDQPPISAGITFRPAPAKERK
jgi:WhiB family redox-sensing transcriptional regulator